MRWLIALMGFLVLVPPAAAADQPIMAPPGEWVQTVALPAPNPDFADRPVQFLLSVGQSFYAADRDEHYFETATLIQNIQGLQSAGTISLGWSPENSDLIIHKAQIVRGGTVTDLLAGNQRFTVLRRENNLESATLDGVLTAVMQPEGLAVGDVLVVAFTIKERAGALPLRGENLLMMPPNLPVRRLLVRDIWADGRQMQWRATEAFGRPQQRRTPLGTEIILSRENVSLAEPPEGAPARYVLAAMYQVSEFRGWNDISALMAPHYERAAAVTPGSALRQEIDRIAALSPDPAVRTEAALRSVQDQVRYFALVMGDGNYLPASAEQTWSRRYGDCKGKTALLLAMLRELGIEAEPVLVSVGVGDVLGQAMPQLRLFDHIIVRARIGGRSYWLDGTRNGDEQLEQLASTVHPFGLPVRAAGAALEAIDYAPPALPLTESDTVYDASRGMAVPARLTTTLTLRGETAAQMRALIAQVGMDSFRRQMLETSPRELGLTSITVEDDQAGGRLLLKSVGEQALKWEPVPGATGTRLRFNNDTINWEPDFERPAGQDGTAPFALSHPVYLVSTETVILPPAAGQFRIEGENFKRVAGGTEISRELTLQGGRAIARSSFRRLNREISADAARESLSVLREIRADRAFVRAPLGAEAGSGAASARPSPALAGAAAPRAAARGLVSSGYAFMQESRYTRAIQDFDRAIALTPEWSLPHANKAVSLAHLNRLEEAEASAGHALRLNADEGVAHQANALILRTRGRYEEALAAATRSIELQDSVYSRGLRGAIHEQMEQIDAALADYRAVVAVEPTHAYALSRIARLLGHLGRTADAITAMEQAVKADPENFVLAGDLGYLLAKSGQAERASATFAEALRRLNAIAPSLGGADSMDFAATRTLLLSHMGRHAEALRVADAALRTQFDNVRVLAARCRARVVEGTQVATGLRDCEAALRYDPENEQATAARALARLRLGQWQSAIDDFDQMLTWNADHGAALYGRGLARIGSGDRTRGESDLAAAKRLDLFAYEPFEQIGLDTEQAQARQRAGTAAQ